MKRVGNLMDEIIRFDTLCEAFLRASRGKRDKAAVKHFREHMDERLAEMSRRLADGSFPFSHYHFFTIYDPKMRTICAAPFEARVAFHAIVKVCDPVFERYQVYDSYACRRGKGTYKALERAQTFTRRYRWFAKLDVCKFFDSIDHEVLLAQLARLFKDNGLLSLLAQIVHSYSSSPGKGLPMGNLTSQYFANHYLAMADHYAKEQLGVRGMVRYMDDILLFDDDKERLFGIIERYKRLLDSILRLKLHQSVVNKTHFGVPFLGYVVHPYKLRLNERSSARIARRAAEFECAWRDGCMAEEECRMRMQCMLAFADKADVRALRSRLFVTG